MRDVGPPLSVFGIGIAIVTPFLQYAFNSVPWYVSYGGMSIGVGILAFGLLLLFFPPSTLTNQPSSQPKSDAVLTPSDVSITSTPKSPNNSKATDLLKWDDHLGHSYSSAADGTIYTQAIQISAQNVSDHEIQLEDAYIVSGETGEKGTLKIGAVGSGWIFPGETNPIPPNNKFTLRAEFNMPDGIAASNFFNIWKVIHLTTKIDGQVHRITIGEDMVAAIYANFRPSPIGYRVTKRQSP